MLYFWLRGMKKALGFDQSNRVVHFVGSLLAPIDSTLGSVSRLYRDNMIRLVWGYKKV